MGNWLPQSAASPPTPDSDQPSPTPGAGGAPPPPVSGQPDPTPGAESAPPPPVADAGGPAVAPSGPADAGAPPSPDPALCVAVPSFRSVVVTIRSHRVDRGRWRLDFAFTLDDYRQSYIVQTPGRSSLAAWRALLGAGPAVVSLNDVGQIVSRAGLVTFTEAPLGVGSPVRSTFTVPVEALRAPLDDALERAVAAGLEFAPDSAAPDEKAPEL